MAQQRTVGRHNVFDGRRLVCRKVKGHDRESVVLQAVARDRNVANVPCVIDVADGVGIRRLVQGKADEERAGLRATQYLCSLKLGQVAVKVGLQEEGRVEGLLQVRGAREQRCQRVVPLLLQAKAAVAPRVDARMLHWSGRRGGTQCNGKVARLRLGEAHKVRALLRVPEQPHRLLRRQVRVEPRGGHNVTDSPCRRGQWAKPMEERVKAANGHGARVRRVQDGLEAGNRVLPTHQVCNVARLFPQHLNEPGQLGIQGTGCIVGSSSKDRPPEGVRDARNAGQRRVLRRRLAATATRVRRSLLHL
mmetsp:Transcript_12110/g.38438  ORF Transcript_12110/g.38438 Transcript_12110/m.38438 type:complete len:305 (+) Transcript_12110:747-1661(+)